LGYSLISCFKLNNLITPQHYLMSHYKGAFNKLIKPFF
jgi:hypothetical protein